MAQVDGSGAGEAAPSAQELEEIVVYGSREGDPTYADPQYEEFWRQQLLDQAARMRLEEEEQWRRSVRTIKKNQQPRIALGYDPKYDRDRRQDLDLINMPSDTIKPATLFRANF